MFRDDDPATGFVLLPDMKWDQVRAVRRRARGCRGALASRRDVGVHGTGEGAGGRSREQGLGGRAKASR